MKKDMFNFAPRLEDVMDQLKKRNSNTYNMFCCLLHENDINSLICEAQIRAAEIDEDVIELEIGEGYADSDLYQKLMRAARLISLVGQKPQKFMPDEADFLFGCPKKYESFSDDDIAAISFDPNVEAIDDRTFYYIWLTIGDFEEITMAAKVDSERGTVHPLPFIPVKSKYDVNDHTADKPLTAAERKTMIDRIFYASFIPDEIIEGIDEKISWVDEDDEEDEDICVFESEDEEFEDDDWLDDDDIDEEDEWEDGEDTDEGDEWEDGEDTDEEDEWEDGDDTDEEDEWEDDEAEDYDTEENSQDDNADEHFKWDTFNIEDFIEMNTSFDEVKEEDADDKIGDELSDDTEDEEEIDPQEVEKMRLLCETMRDIKVLSVTDLAGNDRDTMIFLPGLNLYEDITNFVGKINEIAIGKRMYIYHPQPMLNSYRSNVRIHTSPVMFHSEEFIDGKEVKHIVRTVNSIYTFIEYKK